MAPAPARCRKSLLVVILPFFSTRRSNTALVSWTPFNSFSQIWSADRLSWPPRLARGRALALPPIARFDAPEAMITGVLADADNLFQVPPGMRAIGLPGGLHRNSVGVGGRSCE